MASKSPQAGGPARLVPYALAAAAAFTAYQVLKPVPHDDGLHVRSIGEMPAEGQGSVGGKMVATNKGSVRSDQAAKKAG